MKIRKVLLILVLVAMIFVTSCAKAVNECTVNRDGSIDMKLMCLILKDSDYSTDTEDILDFDLHIWKQTPYEEGNYSGVIWTAHFADVDDYSKNYPDSSMKIEKDGNTYRVSTKTDSFDDIRVYSAFIKQAGGYVNFVLHLPVKPTSHNATSVSEDGKTLTWDMLSVYDSECYCVFKLPSIWGFMIPVVIVIAVAIPSAIIIKKKKKNQNVVINNG